MKVTFQYNFTHSEPAFEKTFTEGTRQDQLEAAKEFALMKMLDIVKIED